MKTEFRQIVELFAVREEQEQLISNGAVYKWANRTRAEQLRLEYLKTLAEQNLPDHEEIARIDKELADARAARTERTRTGTGENSIRKVTVGN
jgi:hypothetical protein